MNYLFDFLVGAEKISKLSTGPAAGELPKDKNCPSMHRQATKIRHVGIVLPMPGVKGPWLQCLVDIGFPALVPSGADAARPSGGPLTFLRQVL